MATNPKIIKPDSESTEFRFASWLSQIISMAAFKNVYLFGGRGLGKTSDILAERVQTASYDMPGAPFAFVGDTYVNLMTNTAKVLIEGLQRKGWSEDYHYILDKTPADEWRKKQYAKLFNYKHTFSIFNGCTINLVSMDRPSSGAGNSYLHLFGDESKYLKFEKLKKLMPAIRGDYTRYGHSPLYRGHTFTSDLPNPLENEDPWMLEMASNMDKQQILDIIDLGFVLNDVHKELYWATMEGSPTEQATIQKRLTRWEDRWIKRRKNSTFFYVASSYVNADILTEGYFDEQLETLGIDEFKRAIASIKTFLERGKMFYGNLSDRHFYTDGYNYDYYDQFDLRENIQQTSRGLRYIRPNSPLEAGYDAGNMMSLVIGQNQKPYYRCLKNLFTLTPEWIEDLAQHYTEFFKDHPKKELLLRYDRAANQYSKAKRDFASKLKNSIEKVNGKRTGWSVKLMNVGQANITHAEEYDLMNDIMSERDPRLPRLLIDKFECKELKSSLELAPMDKVSGKIKKIKKSEQLPLKRLPLESTNMSDAFKYLMCRPEWIEISKKRSVTYVGKATVR